MCARHIISPLCAANHPPGNTDPVPPSTRIAAAQRSGLPLQLLNPQPAHRGGGAASAGRAPEAAGAHKRHPGVLGWLKLPRQVPMLAQVEAACVEAARCLSAVHRWQRLSHLGLNCSLLLHPSGHEPAVARRAGRRRRVSVQLHGWFVPQRGRHPNPASEMLPCELCCCWPGGCRAACPLVAHLTCPCTLCALQARRRRGRTQRRPTGARLCGHRAGTAHGRGGLPRLMWVRARSCDKQYLP